jgi:hypothetical protein
MFGIGSPETTSAEDNRQASTGQGSPNVRQSVYGDHGAVSVGGYGQLQTGGIRNSGTVAGADLIGGGAQKVTGKNALNLAGAKGNTVTVYDSTPAVLEDALGQVATLAQNSINAGQAQSASLGDYFSQILQAQQQNNAQNLSQLSALSQPQQINRMALYVVLSMLAAAVLAIFALMRRS